MALYFQGPNSDDSRGSGVEPAKPAPADGAKTGAPPAPGATGPQSAADSQSSTRVQARGSGVATYAKTRIEVVAGPNRGVQLDGDARPVRIGSSLENDLVLEDDTVSRQHCEIIPTSSGVRVRDRDSTNGVFIEDSQILDAVFSATVTLKLGSSELRVVLLPETTDRQLAGSDHFGKLIGESARMRALFADLERIAPTDVSLLIEGETGTGKEVVAESVHLASPRAAGPFVVLDCSAVPPTLIESELFGHERGAFTSAVRRHAGVFEQAHGGTIFIDELGELPLEMQPRLLRVLQKREVRRLGATSSTPIDVRVIAATHRNLMAEVQHRRFREDLFYRIAATQVLVPPLRDRLEDLPQLVEHLSREFNPHSPPAIPSDIWQMFRAHRWPGNVRELQNTLQRWMVTPERVFPQGVRSEGGSETSRPGESAELLPLPAARRQASDAFERHYLGDLMKRANGSVSAAAQLAQVSRQMIQKLLQKHRVGGATTGEPDDGV